MASPLIAIVGDVSPTRTYDPVLRDAAKARQAAEELGAELAKRGWRLLVYGGPFLEADVVRGFVGANPKHENSIVMRYTQENAPPDFPEEANNKKLFIHYSESGSDWEVAFYRAITRADGIILMGGGNAAKISGLVAIGFRLPILALAEFGGGANKVCSTLSPDVDLPTREECDLMRNRWSYDSAAICIDALHAQIERRLKASGAPSLSLLLVTMLLFLAALAIVPWVWGQNNITVWMMFIVPLLAGGAGALIRLIIDRLRGTQDLTSGMMVAVVLGLVAGGIAGVLFVTAQLTAVPDLMNDADAAKLVSYARRSIPFALGVGFIAGLTSDAVFGKLLGLDTINVKGIVPNPPQA